MFATGTPACRRLGFLATAAVLTLVGTSVAAAARPDEPVSGRPPAAERLERARPEMAEAARLHAEAPTVEHERRLASVYMAEGGLDQALDHYSAALRLQPDNVASLEGSARIWRDWGYLGIALPLAYRAAFWGPESAAAQNTLGTVLLEAGEVDAAAVRFARARELAPDAAFPINNLCYLELQRSRPDAAAPLCRLALERSPASQVIRNNLVMALARASAFDEARAVSRAGDDPTIAAYNEGIVWLAARQPRHAMEAFGRARRANPSYSPAIQTLRRLVGVGRNAE